MDEKSLDVFHRFDINSLLYIEKKDFDKNLKDNLNRIIFYSSSTEGNRLNEDTVNLLLNGNIIIKNGLLQHYIEIINNEKVYKKLVELSNKYITTNDVISLRKTLFENIIGSGTYKQFKRFRLYSLPAFAPDSIEKELNRILKTMNTKPIDASDAFIRSCTSHTDFEFLHPFEDGNGRTGRLLLNIYLMKSHVAPITTIVLTPEQKEKCFNCLQANQQSEHTYYTGVIYGFLAISLNKEKRDILLEKFKTIDQKDLDEVEFRDIFMSVLGLIDLKEIEKDIQKLYHNSLGEEHYAMAALCLADMNRLNSPIIKDALKHKNSKIRGVAIKPASNFSNDYTKELLYMACNDDNFMNRSRAVRGLRFAKLENNQIETLYNYMLTKEKNEAVIINFITYVVYRHPDIIDKFYDKMSNKLDSKSRVVVWSAFRVLLCSSSIEKAVKAMTYLSEKKDYNIIDFMSSLFNYQLMGDRVYNPEIAKVSCEVGLKSEKIRKTILGNMANYLSQDLGPIAEEHIKFLDEVIKTTNVQIEKIYALYNLGLVKGYSYITKKYNVSIRSENPTELNIALFLVKIKTKEKDAVVEAFNVKDNKLNLVEVAEINKIIKNDNFGKDFLLFCSKELKTWN